MSSIDVTVNHNDRFIIAEQHFVDPEADVRRLIMRQVMDTQERAIREALIKMGWTPPKREPSLSEEFAAFEAFDYGDRCFRLRREGQRYIYATTEKELVAFRAGAAWERTRITT